MNTIVILHGSFGNSQENWIPYLRNHLEEKGDKVITPQFPVDTWENIVEKGEGYKSTIQNLNNWINTFEKDVLPNLPKEHLTFIGHSISSIFILHLVNRFNLQLDKAIFVSPFLSILPKWEFTTVNGTFYKTDFDFERIKKSIKERIAIFSDNDPHVPEEKFEEFVRLTESKPFIVKDGGHLNAKAGYLEFPLILQCLE
ncbi:MAG TPA: alpha/beta hydrolase [Patescibacteria group bacterium]